MKRSLALCALLCLLLALVRLPGAGARAGLGPGGDGGVTAVPGRRARRRLSENHPGPGEDPPGGPRPCSPCGWAGRRQRGRARRGIGTYFVFVGRTPPKR